MRDDVDELVARQFERLDDVEVTDTWDRVLATVGTKRPQRDGRRWKPALVAATVVVLTAAAVVVVRWSDPSDWVSSRPPPTAEVSTGATQPPTPGSGSVLDPPFGDAIATPAAVAAGGVVAISPSEPVASTCTEIGVIREVTSGRAFVGQLKRDGEYLPGPDVSWPACRTVPADDPISYVIPDGLPLGPYVLCVTEELDPSGCATITILESAPPSEAGAPSPSTSPSTAGGAVSYLAPPPTLGLRSLGTVELTPREGGEIWVDVAIGDRGILVNQSWAGYVTMMGFDGTQRDVPVDGRLGPIVYGPGDVVYGLRDGSSIEEFAMAVVALDGDRAGTTVASVPMPISQYMELPAGAFGHGSDGVVDRHRDVNATVLEYVDVLGEPVTWTGPDPVLLTVAYQVPATAIGDVTVTASDGSSWQLDIEASPTRASPYIGPSPAAPGSDGVAVLWTHIGPDARPDIDFGEPTMHVIAALHNDGTIEWRSIPGGWQVVASDVWGTVLAKQLDGRIDLALADFAADGSNGT